MESSSLTAFEKIIVEKFVAISGIDIDPLNLRVKERSKNPTGCITFFENEVEDEIIYDLMPDAFVGIEKVMVGFLIYLVGERCSAIEYYIADDNEELPKTLSPVDFASEVNV